MLWSMETPAVEVTSNNAKILDMRNVFFILLIELESSSSQWAITSPQSDHCQVLLTPDQSETETGTQPVPPLGLNSN